MVSHYYEEKNFATFTRKKKPAKGLKMTDKTNQQAELENCPFCGKQPSHAERMDLGTWQVICYCDALGPLIEQNDEVKNFEEKGARKAIKAWNTRAQPKPAMQDEEIDFDALANKILYHIDTMYPGMWSSVPKSARTSLRNTIKSQTKAAIKAMRDVRKAPETIVHFDVMSESVAKLAMQDEEIERVARAICLAQRAEAHYLGLKSKKEYVDIYWPHLKETAKAAIAAMNEGRE